MRLPARVLLALLTVGASIGTMSYLLLSLFLPLLLGYRVMYMTDFLVPFEAGLTLIMLGLGVILFIDYLGLAVDAEGRKGKR